MLCGYQLNKIKFELENFLAKLKDAGADIEFVFKRAVADDQEFLRRRLRDYRMGCEIIRTIASQGDFEKLNKLFHKEENFPFNTLILVSIIQSARKFGTVHGFSCLNGKPTVQQTELARQKDAICILGLDTSYFIMPGNWKIWCDSKLNMEEMTVQEIDPNIVMAHFELKSNQGPLFACLLGDMKSKSKSVVNKITQHFGSKNVFPNVAKFMRRLKSTTIDEMIPEIVETIFGKADAESIKEDLKISMKAFEVNENVGEIIETEILEMIKNDFVNIAEEILLNLPIFIGPTFLDMRKTDMMTINDLILPIIQKTCGILLKNFKDPEPRTLIIIKTHSSEFSSVPVNIIFPDFQVPTLKVLLAGEMSTFEKMEILYWITGIEFSDFELMVIPEEYVADVVILLYLMKNDSLNLIEARCILKTLVDARRRSLPLECSTIYPKMIHERGYRCSFLYLKMYFYFHSCLSSLGLKNLCPEIQFDGVYFQKIYALNIETEQDSENDLQKANKEEHQATVSDIKSGRIFTAIKRIRILDEFETIIRMWNIFFAFQTLFRCRLKSTASWNRWSLVDFARNLNKTFVISRKLKKSLKNKQNFLTLKSFFFNNSTRQVKFYFFMRNLLSSETVKVL